MVKALILASPDPQVWHLLGLPAPGEAEVRPTSAEDDAAGSDELESFLL